MEIYRDIIQGSPEWNALRIGSIGGSSISKAVAGGQGKTRIQLMYDLVGEILSGQKKEGYVSQDMLAGIENEAKARDLYSSIYDVEIEQIGLIKYSEFKHYSPDGLISPVGMAEIKYAIPSVFVETKATGKIATDRRRQMQYGMGVCNREWCDYIMYCPAVEKTVDPLFVIHVQRDEKEIEWLNAECDKFINDMKSLLLTIMKGG